MEVCTPIPKNCDTCKELTLTYDALMNVLAGLTPASTPYIWITDKFGKQFKDQVTIAGNGSFNINQANFPSGMFNPIAGSFDLFVSSDVNGVTILNVFSTFKCIIFSISC